MNAAVTGTRKMAGGGLIIRAEMFGQLTSGLETPWNKLKGEGSSLFLSLTCKCNSIFMPIFDCYFPN